MDERRRDAWVVVGLFLSVAMLYAPVRGFSWSWCDDYTVADNPFLRDGAGLLALWRGGVTDQYYPITFSVYWLVTRLVGSDPAVFHALNVAFHGLSSALLFLLLRRSGFALSVTAAALFAFHPLQVESVAWIYELKNPLSLALLLVTALAHRSYCERGGLVRASAALLCFVLALLAKTVVLVYPAVAALAFLFLAPGASPSTRRRAWCSVPPLVVLSVAAAFLTILHERGVTGAVGAEYPGGALHRVRVAGLAFWFYVGKLTFPWPLSFAYAPLTGSALARWGTASALAGLVLTAFACAAMRAGRSRASVALSRLGLAGVALVLCLAPVLGFVDIYMMRYTQVADHLAYLASVPFAFGLAALLWSGPRGRNLRRAVTAVLLLASATTARLHLAHFSTERRLWEHALEQEQDLWWAHLRLGQLAHEQGDIEEAVSRCEASVRVKPTQDGAVTLGSLYAAQGRGAEALEQFAEALRLGPLDRGARHSHASALAAAGRLDQAIAAYEELSRDASDPLASQSLRQLEDQASRLDAECDRLRRITRERRTDPTAWRRLSLILLVRGRHDTARQALERWYELMPQSAEARDVLAEHLCTAPMPASRDASRALYLLQPLLTEDAPPARILVAATAAAGSRDFARAVELARRSLEAAERSGDRLTVQKARSALRRYQDGRPPP